MKFKRTIGKDETSKYEEMQGEAFPGEDEEETPSNVQIDNTRNGDNSHPGFPVEDAAGSSVYMEQLAEGKISTISLNIILRNKSRTRPTSITLTATDNLITAALPAKHRHCNKFTTWYLLLF